MVHYLEEVFLLGFVQGHTAIALDGVHPGSDIHTKVDMVPEQCLNHFLGGVDTYTMASIPNIGYPEVLDFILERLTHHKAKVVEGKD